LQEAGVRKDGVETMSVDATLWKSRNTRKEAEKELQLQRMLRLKLILFCFDCSEGRRVISQ
jgi:hypothetical protein